MMPCPTDQELQSFLSGAISAAGQESVSRHLDSCTSCIARLSGVVSAPDPLLGALRAAGADSPTLEPSILHLLSESTDVVAGQRIGPYEIMRKLGEGGMGAVYKVRHELLGKVFALKLLPAGHHRDPDRTMRFEREIKAVGKLEHPHIVRATDAGSHDGVPYLAMELVEGADLARIVHKRGALRPADACEIGRQAALALEHAHQQKLIHRDVKPSNLLLTPDGTVKLLDLGLALAAGDPNPPRKPSNELGAILDDGSLTATGLALGTRDYMAPEQAANPHGVDARADVYSLGATLHFLLTRRSPAEPVDHKTPLGDVLKRMLARNPDERYATAGEAGAALARLSKGHDLAALSLGAPPQKRGPRRWAMAASLLLVVLTSIAAVVAATRTPVPTPAVEAPPSAEPPGESFAVAPMPRLKPPPPFGTLPMTIEDAQQLQRDWALHLDQLVEEPGPGGVRTVLIPPGEFELAPRYIVSISKPYRLGTTEVTRQQFQAFVTARRYVPASDDSAILKTFGVLKQSPKLVGNWKEPGFPYSEETPITHVSRADAEAYVEWLSSLGSKKYRLPTEAEWRWACRAGASTRWPFGDDAKQLAQYARYKNNTRGFPERTGSLRPNAWGLFDMLGNVREWTQDGNESYPEGRYVDPVLPSKGGLFRLCGGTFEGRTEYGEWQLGWRMATCDCSTAVGYHWYSTTGDAGFRICREP